MCFAHVVLAARGPPRSPRPRHRTVISTGCAGVATFDGRLRPMRLAAARAGPRRRTGARGARRADSQQALQRRFLFGLPSAASRLPPGAESGALPLHQREHLQHAVVDRAAQPVSLGGGRLEPDLFGVLALGASRGQQLREPQAAYGRVPPRPEEVAEVICELRNEGSVSPSLIEVTWMDCIPSHGEGSSQRAEHGLAARRVRSASGRWHRQPRCRRRRTRRG